jgi:CheY-like chemotaxis protein
VLAVDDCEVMRVVLCASLASLGYSVQAVDSGWAALAAVDQATFDAVILDVEMPGLDGMAVGRALRLNPKNAKTGIAMHSGLAEDAVRAGFSAYDDFLPKPCSPQALRERLAKLISKRAVG